tara:strand:+ start:647 stop:1090 length:444 start_codon:yes stop_codon:yes gene_type:complete
LKNFNQTLFTIFLSLFIGCSNEGKKNKKDLNEGPSPTRQNNLSLKSPVRQDYDPCDCNKRSQKILDETITYRLQFDSIGEIKKDQESKKQIRGFAKEYMELVKKCFEVNQARLLAESECNNLKLLQSKKDSLRRLGIQIEQGESIRL